MKVLYCYANKLKTYIHISPCLCNKIIEEKIETNIIIPQKDIDIINIPEWNYLTHKKQLGVKSLNTLLMIWHTSNIR